MDDRVVATIGLLVGGLAVAFGLVAVAGSRPTPELAWAILVGSLVAAIAFSTRRHGLVGRSVAAILAGVAGVVLLGAGAVTLFQPVPVAFRYAVASGLFGLAIGTLAVASEREIPPERVAGGIRAVSVAVLLILGAFLIAAVLLTIPALIPGELSPIAESAGEQLALGLGFVAATVGFLLMTGRQLGYLDIAMPDRRAIGWAGGGIVVVIATAILMGLVYSLIGVEGAEHEMSRRAREQGAAVLLIGMPLTLLVTAVGEELLYRNGVQKYLTEQFAPMVAIVLTSILFAVAHLPALTAVGAAGLVATLSMIFVLSVIIGIIYERTGNVIVPIVVHGTYNVFVFLLWYVDLVG